MGGSGYEGIVSAGDLCVASTAEVVGTLVFLHGWGPYVAGITPASCPVSLHHDSYDLQESLSDNEKQRQRKLVFRGCISTLEAELRDSEGCVVSGLDRRAQRATNI